MGLTTRTIKKRICEHVSYGTYIGKALAKHGISAFDISIIDEANTIIVLYEKEKYWIAHYGCKHPNGYNLTDGGDGRLGYKTTDETKQLMSRNRKGRIPWNKGLTKELDSRMNRLMTEEHKDKIRRALLGHTVTERTRLKISESQKGKRLGVFCTQEHKDKISQARMGMKFTDEHKSNLSKAHRRTNERTCFGNYPLPQLPLCVKND